MSPKNRLISGKGGVTWIARTPDLAQSLSPHFRLMLWEKRAWSASSFLLCLSFGPCSSLSSADSTVPRVLEGAGAGVDCRVRQGWEREGLCSDCSTSTWHWFPAVAEAYSWHFSCSKPVGLWRLLLINPSDLESTPIKATACSSQALRPPLPMENTLKYHLAQQPAFSMQLFRSLISDFPVVGPDCLYRIRCAQVLISGWCP